MWVNNYFNNYLFYLGGWFVYIYIYSFAVCVSSGFSGGTYVHVGRLGGDSPGKDLINVLLVCFIASVFTLGY